MKTIISLVLVFCIIHLSAAQQKLSVGDAVNIALKKRLSVKRTSLDQQIAEQELVSGKRKLLPELRAEATLQYNPTIPTSIIPVGQFNPVTPTSETRAVQFGQPWSNSAGVVASQVLYDGKLFGEIREKRIERQLAGLTIVSETERIKYDVAATYYSVVLAQQELNFSVSDTVKTFQMFRLATNRFQAQVADISERNKAELSLITSRNKFVKAQKNLHQQLDKLWYELGVPSDSLKDAIFNFDDITSPTAPLRDDITSFDRNVQYQTTVAEQGLLDQQLITAKGALKPRISLNGFFGGNQYSQSFELFRSGSWFGNSYVNLTLQIPISNIYTRTSVVKIAAYRQQQNQIALQELKQQLSFELQSASSDLEAARKNYKNATLGLRLAEEIYRDAERKVKEGRALQSDLSTAYNDVQEIQLQVLQAMYEIFSAELKIRRTSGLL